MELFVDKVLQFRLLHVDQLHIQGMDFNAHKDSLGVDLQQGYFVVNASQIPRVVWEVSALWLEVGHGSKLFGGEVELSVFLVVL